MTILAVMSYQTTPWEELAKKPSIRKTLKYVAIRGNSHYDEMEALAKELIRKHFDGITQKMALGFLKIIRGVSNEERPTKLIEYTPFPAQYYAIHHGLHQLIRGEHPDDAAVIIHCAIEDGILFPTIPRSLLVDEFNLKKSSFDKYFSKYHVNLEYESDAVKKQVEEKIKYHRRSLRNAIGYNVTDENKVYFYDRKLGRKNFLSMIIAYCRSIFRF